MSMYQVNEAKYIKDVEVLGGMGKLYKLAEEIDAGIILMNKWERTEYLLSIVPIRYVIIADIKSQVYIYPADVDGKIISWNKFETIHRKNLSDAELLKELDIEITEDQYELSL